jgi:hypothetical protein
VHDLIQRALREREYKAWIRGASCWRAGEDWEGQWVFWGEEVGGREPSRMAIKVVTWLEED